MKKSNFRIKSSTLCVVVVWWNYSQIHQGNLSGTLTIIPTNIAFSVNSATGYCIQYIALIWPRYSLRGLHIRITWFSSKTSDTALLLVIALTTFQCIISASITKGALVCFVVTVHWWRHKTHYHVTEVYDALRIILTVHLNNGATRADLRGIPKHCEVKATAERQSTIYGWFWCDLLHH